MKQYPVTFLKQDRSVSGSDSGEDAKESLALIERVVTDTRAQLAQVAAGNDVARAELLLQLGRALIRLERMLEAWGAGREAFDIFAAHEQWDSAVQACDIMFSADQSQSLAALGQGLWLAVTYPINPELTVALLNHVVEETPPDSDGAAVAAITAHYIVELRAKDPQRENLLLFTNQLLATVARRHSAVEGQEDFEKWVKRLELEDPALFLPRLRNVIDVLVQDDWWIDREALQAKLPA